MKDKSGSKIRWGFLGAGSIATRFGTGFQEVEGGGIAGSGFPHGPTPTGISREV